MAYEPVTYTAGAAQEDFTITFDFLRDAHIEVVIDDVAKTLNTHYTIVSNHTVVRLVTPATGGEEVVISRDTPVDERIVDFTAGGGVTETDLDESALQIFFALEELIYITDVDNLTDAVDDAQAAAAAAAASSTSAASSASAASTSASAAATSATSAATSAAAATALTNLRGFIADHTLVSTSTTVVTVGDGACVSQDSARAAMQLTSSETITVTVSGVGGLGVARSVSTWYHAFVIKKVSDGTIDVYADTSVTAANIPSGYTSYRRVGSFYLNATGSGEVDPFIQYGDEFYWLTPVLSYNADPGATTAFDITLRTPLGIKTRAHLNAVLAATDGEVYISSKDTVDLAADATAVPLVSVYNNGGDHAIDGSPVHVWTSTTSVVRGRRTAGTVRVAVLGWRDLRGTDI